LQADRMRPVLEQLSTTTAGLAGQSFSTYYTAAPAEINA